MYDALPIEDKILVVAALFFTFGVLTPIILKKSNENEEKQRKEELDEEIALQLKEYEIMLTKHNRFSTEEALEYERLLSEYEGAEFNF